MDAMLENMRNTLGNGVRKMFSTNIGVKNGINTTEKHPQPSKIFAMSLHDLCTIEKKKIPFIVQDICKYISQKAIKVEGIFRLSPPGRLIKELREIYERNNEFDRDLLLNHSEYTEAMGHASAGLLKQFFRQLPDALIDDKIMQIFAECKSLSDETFSERVSSCMSGWLDTHRCTLLFLLSFLHTVAQESSNRMSVNALAVVFGPNVFKLPSGIEGLQAQSVANNTFERLLSCSSLLCQKCPDVDPLLNSKQKTTSPTRPLPPTPISQSQTPQNKPVPRPRRPPPPPPMFNSPLSSPRQEGEGRIEVKLEISDRESGTSDVETKSEDRSEKIEQEEEENQYAEISEDIVIDEKKNSKSKKEFRRMLDTSIRQVVCSRLFNSTESSSVSDDAESLMMSSEKMKLLPSTTSGRVRGPKNRRKPSRRKQMLLEAVHLDGDSDEDKPTANPSAPTATNPVTTVITPDSGCIVEDPEYPRNSSPIERELSQIDIGGNISPVEPEDIFIPKLNLRSSMEEEEIKMIEPTPKAEPVPQLDLSSVIESEDYVKPEQLQWKQEVTKVREKDKTVATTPPHPLPRQSVKHGAKKKKKRNSFNSKPQAKKLETSQNVRTTSSTETEEKEEETMEETKNRLLTTLRENRKIAGRMYDVSKMDCDELKDEKLSMQRELLKFESKHGRPSTKESRDVMREVYDRYRSVKRSIAKWKRSEAEQRDENDNTISNETVTQQETGDSFSVTQVVHGDMTSCEDSDVTIEGEYDVRELQKQVQELRAKRKKLRKILKEFEQQNSEKKLDRRIMRTEYQQYRDVKYKLRSLEVTLSKANL